jgi:Dolichyl-phosphate-mannose-protein mannosyltransferase
MAATSHVPRRREADAQADAWWPAAIVVLIIAAASLIRYRLVDLPLERDEGEYAYLGQLILRGEVPYQAAANMKLPGIYYAYAAVLWLFGESAAGIRRGLMVVNGAAIGLVFVLGRRLLDVPAALMAAASYAVLSLSVAVLGFTANSEHFVLVPVLLGAVRLADTRPGARRPLAVLATGVCFGLGFVTKQHAVAFLLFGGLFLLSGRRTRDALLFTVGALVPYGITCALMGYAGAFEPFWFWTVTYAREYVSFIPLAVGLAELGLVLRRLVDSSATLWGLAAAGLGTLWWTVPSPTTRRFLLLFTACSALAVTPGLRFFEHYFMFVAPAASLLAGAAIGTIPRFASGAVAALVAVAALISCLWQDRAILFELPPLAVARAAFGENPFPEIVEIARWLQERTDPNERIGVIGSEPQLYFYANRRSATGAMYLYPLMEPQPFALAMQETMIAEFERAQPRYLVVVNVSTSWSRRPDSHPRLQQWAEATINDQYDMVGLAEIRRTEPTRYRWGADALRGVRPETPSFVATFERRP